MGLAFASAFVAVGAVVQGSVGFGLALVVVPVLALVRPEELPAVMLLLTMPTAGFMIVRVAFRGREWSYLDLVGASSGDAGGRGATRAGTRELPLGAVRRACAGGRARESRKPEDPTAQPNQARGKRSIGAEGHGGRHRRPAARPRLPGPLGARDPLDPRGSLPGRDRDLARRLFFAGRLEWEDALLVLQLLPGLFLSLFSTSWIAPLLDRW
jgi:hypothetical protein